MNLKRIEDIFSVSKSKFIMRSLLDENRTKICYFLFLEKANQCYSKQNQNHLLFFLFWVDVNNELSLKTGIDLNKKIEFTKKLIKNVLLSQTLVILFLIIMNNIPSILILKKKSLYTNPIPKLYQLKSSIPLLNTLKIKR